MCKCNLAGVFVCVFVFKARRGNKINNQRNYKKKKITLKGKIAEKSGLCLTVP